MKRKGMHRFVAVFLTITMYLSCMPVTDAYAATTKEKLEQAEKEQAEVKGKLENYTYTVSNGTVKTKVFLFDGISTVIPLYKNYIFN